MTQYHRRTVSPAGAYLPRALESYAVNRVRLGQEVAPQGEALAVPCETSVADSIRIRHQREARQAEGVTPGNAERVCRAQHGLPVDRPAGDAAADGRNELAAARAMRQR